MTSSLCVTVTKFLVISHSRTQYFYMRNCALIGLKLIIVCITYCKKVSVMLEEM